MDKTIAEFIGTFTLVLFGCGAAVFAGSAIGVIGVSLAFGLALLAMVYAIGPVSGCHINPAVSLGHLVAGNMEPTDFVSYVIAQCLGAIAAAFIIFVIVAGRVSGFETVQTGIGQNGWGAGFQSGYNVFSAFIYEFVATLLFVITVLGATQSRSATALAGVAVGGMLMLVHMVGIPITGTSVNPARSLGPALFSGWTAISQLWLFILAPALGAVVAGLMFRSGILSGDHESRLSRDFSERRRLDQREYGSDRGLGRATRREIDSRSRTHLENDRLPAERDRVSPGPLRRY